MRFYNYWLYEEFLLQKKKREISLRAFASEIGVNITLLSQVFRGERDLNVKQVSKIVKHLELSERKREKILEGYEFLKIKKADIRERIKLMYDKDQTHETIALDEDEYVSATRPIIYLTFMLCSMYGPRAKDYEHLKRVIAAKLDTDIKEIEESFCELSRLGLVERSTEYALTKYDNIVPSFKIVNSQIMENNYQFAKRCYQAYFPEKNTKGEVAHSLDPEIGGTDIISWEYFYLSKQEKNDFLKFVEDYKNKIETLSITDNGKKLLVHYFGIQIFKALK